jgi:REP element-mobilizing transposase RayT
MNIFERRKGGMFPDQTYFYTHSIFNFIPLLANDNLKNIVAESLYFLVEHKLMKLYGFVIMPNHVHIIWRPLDTERKESPAGSFTKYTAHRFKEYLLKTDERLLESFYIGKKDRQFQFWQRDPLSIPLTSEKALIQKLNYIHLNPVREKWQLANLPEQFYWSSAKFYEESIDDFGFITHFRE